MNLVRSFKMFKYNQRIKPIKEEYSNEITKEDMLFNQ